MFISQICAYRIVVSGRTLTVERFSTIECTGEILPPCPAGKFFVIRTEKLEI
jgi:hypothetical protein